MTNKLFSRHFLKNSDIKENNGQYLALVIKFSFSNRRLDFGKLVSKTEFDNLQIVRDQW